MHVWARHSRHSHLRGKDVDDGLRMDEAGVAEVVKATAVEDLATCLPPHCLSKGCSLVLGKQLGCEAPCCAKHGPAAVEDLDLAVAGECLGVGGQTRRVLQGAYQSQLVTASTPDSLCQTHD